MDMDDYYLPPSEMSEQEESALWEKFIATHDQRLRDRLIEHYAILVWQTAERIASKLPSFISIDDLIGWGNLGLMDAIERYDTGRGTKFSTYCCTRITGHIIDELRRLDWTPRLVRLRAHQIERARDELHNRLGREPDDDEMAKAMGISEHEYDEMVKETQPRNLISLNHRQDDDNGNEIGKIELLPDYSVADPLTELQRAEIKEVAIRGLNEDQKKVLVMYYYDELNMKEIGEILKLSESRVCQIHKQILEFLKAKFADHQLERVP